MSPDKRERCLTALQEAEQKVEDIQAAIDELKDRHPNEDFSQLQAPVDSLNARLTNLAVVLDQPDDPIVEF